MALKIEATNRDRSEQAELAIRTFELSQALEEKWLTADYSAKRQILETVFLNLKLDGVSLCYEMTKPFDALAKGLLVPSNRGDKTPVELFLRFCAEIADSCALRALRFQFSRPYL